MSSVPYPTLCQVSQEGGGLGIFYSRLLVKAGLGEKCLVSDGQNPS